MDELETSVSGNIKIVAVPRACLRFFQDHPDYQRLEIQPFTPAEANEFCDQVGELPPFRLLRAWGQQYVPLFLRFWCELPAEQRADTYTQYRLFEQITARMVSREREKWDGLKWRRGSEPPGLGIDRVVRVLAAVAYEALSRDHSRVLDSEILREVLHGEQVRKVEPDASVDTILEALITYNCLIGTIGGTGQLEFYHEQFCYFLATNHIINIFGLTLTDRPDCMKLWRWGIYLTQPPPTCGAPEHKTVRRLRAGVSGLPASRVRGLAPSGSGAGAVASSWAQPGCSSRGIRRSRPARAARTAL